MAASCGATNAYLEVSFSGGSLGAGASTGEIQTRFSKPDFSSFNESNDYFYRGGQSTYADSTVVTVYNNGTRVWGTPPSGCKGPGRFTTPGPGAGRRADCNRNVAHEHGKHERHAIPPAHSRRRLGRRPRTKVLIGVGYALGPGTCSGHGRMAPGRDSPNFPRRNPGLIATGSMAREQSRASDISQRGKPNHAANFARNSK